MSIKTFENTCYKLAIAITCIWFLTQVVLLFLYWDINQSFDAPYYMKQAILHSVLKMPYPTIENLYDTYIQSPGYINVLAIFYLCFDDYHPMLLLNIFLNTGIAANIFYLGNKLFDKTTASIAVIIYCCIPSNAFTSIWLLTEVPYLFVCLTAFNLALRKGKANIIIAGVLLAFAQTIRPIASVFMFCIIIYFIIHKYTWKKYAMILLSYSFILLLSGLYAMKQTGSYVTSSTVEGYDLMYTAYDGADGGQHPWYVFSEEGPGYIENATHVSFSQKNAIWKERSMKWILSNPLRYLELCIKRPSLMYKSDLWSIPYFINHFNDHSATLLLLKTIFNLPFYISLILFFISIAILKEHILSTKGILLLNIILGTGATCLFGAEMRYHHAYIFVTAIYAAFAIKTTYYHFANSCDRTLISPSATKS